MIDAFLYIFLEHVVGFSFLFLFFLTENFNFIQFCIPSVFGRNLMDLCISVQCSQHGHMFSDYCIKMTTMHSTAIKCAPVNKFYFKELETLHLDAPFFVSIKVSITEDNLLFQTCMLNDFLKNSIPELGYSSCLEKAIPVSMPEIPN